MFNPTFDPDPIHPPPFEKQETCATPLGDLPRRMRKRSDPCASMGVDKHRPAPCPMWLQRGAWTKETIEPRRQMGAWKVVHPCKEGRIGRHAWKRHHIDRSIVSISFGEAFTANQPELDVKAAGEFGLTSMFTPSTSSPSKLR